MPLPAVVAVNEGINLPRYPSLPGRLRAREEGDRRVVPTPVPGGPEMIRLSSRPRSSTRPRSSATAPTPRPRVVEMLREIGRPVSAILGLVEHDARRPGPAEPGDADPGPPSGRRAGVPLHAVLVGEGAAEAALVLGPAGVTTAHVVTHPRLDAYAPVGLGHRAGRDRGHDNAGGRPGAGKRARQRGPGPSRGPVAGLPMSANTTDVTVGERWRIVRQRWAGSLLEEAWLDGEPRLLTSPRMWSPRRRSAPLPRPRSSRHARR